MSVSSIIHSTKRTKKNKEIYIRKKRKEKKMKNTFGLKYDNTIEAIAGNNSAKSRVAKHLPHSPCYDNRHKIMKRNTVPHLNPHRASLESPNHPCSHNRIPLQL